ncbi:MAG: UdgX family uracil-DNA binding protein [Caulobacteraceae bacterium]|nr:UdgX family uracil-DNA binding protein [Caulobacteraceae bacterium]
MRIVELAGETDLAGWRRAARGLRLEGVAPDEVCWSVARADLFGAPDHAATGVAAPADRALTVPPALISLAEGVACHRSPERFALLYRLLWRLRDEPRLLELRTDGDIAAALAMAKAVARASHKMKAFVRFRRVDGARPETFVAWFEPPHRVVERTAPFFARRFANLRFSILTPDLCCFWDGRALRFEPGVAKPDVPTVDDLESYWLTYYASIFNPARLKVAAMQSEMPKRYWRNLPEATLIPGLIDGARQRSEAMMANEASEPARRLPARPTAPVGPANENRTPDTLDEVAAGVMACRRCDLWRDATRGVAGEGAGRARLMLVGEQPGDLEDLAGRPFIGPAGQVLDRALAAAGVPRQDAYVTNAVKHFKHEPRGKRRLHKTPGTGEVTACRWWLDHERRIVGPRVIVALGGTAALAVFGRPMPIMKSRGRPFALDGGAQAVITVHPSFLRRLPDERAKAEAYRAFVDDLAAAHALLA